MRRAAVGNSQETWFVDAVTPAGERALVLRRGTGSGALDWTDRAVELAALTAAAAAGLPVPRVLWSGVLERPYFVMERVAGAPPRRGDDVSRELGDLLARLHALDPAELGPAVPRPEGAALPAGGVAGELDRWEARYREARLAALPVAGALFGWLRAHVPPEAPPALLWGDPGPYNLLVADGRITALLDWELAHLGHPLDDLGAAQWACFGILDPDAILAGYEARAGAVDRDALRWFRCLACMSRTVMLLASNRAWAEGRTHRPSLAALGLDLVARNLARAADEAGWEDAGGHREVAGDRPADGRRNAGGGRDVAGGGPAGGRRHAGSGERGAAPAATPPIVARPSPAELAAGLARFVEGDVLPATADRALRRELKNAVALLDTLALLQPRDDRDQAALEDEARRLELERAPDRGAMRARLLRDLTAADAPLEPLRRLLT